MIPAYILVTIDPEGIPTLKCERCGKRCVASAQTDVREAKPLPRMTWQTFGTVALSELDRFALQHLHGAPIGAVIPPKQAGRFTLDVVKLKAAEAR